MQKLKTPVIIITIIVILILIKVIFLSPAKPGQGKGPGGQGGPGGSAPSAVTGYVVKPQTLNNEVYASGSVTANEEAELKPEVSGKIVSLNIPEGGKVSKGTLLVKINDADLQAQLRKLQYQLKLAEEQEARQKKLFDISGISQQEYDIALNQLNTLKADIENMSAQIAKTEIRAPFNGTIGLRKVSEGAYITPATVVATMQQLDPVKIDFSVPEKYLGQVSKGDKVFFTLQGVDGTQTATIYAIDPKIDPSTRTIQIRAMAPNGAGRIFPGAFARIQLALKQNKDALVVPTESLIPVLKGQKVFLYRSGKAFEQMVETGTRTPVYVEIVKGLQPGDTVVVTGMMSIKQDAPLTLVNVK